MTTQQAEAVVQSVRIAAKPETIFPFFTDPVKMVRWKGTTADLDPRPGGTYHVNVNGHDVAKGEYVEITPSSRVVFTWGWEGEDSAIPPGSSKVEVDLERDGEETVVTLRHSGLPAEARARHAEGWEHYMERLRIAGGGGDPGPDPQVEERM